MSTEVERARGPGARRYPDRSRPLEPLDAALYEEAIRRQEAVIAADGPLACRTGQHTGRSPERQVRGPRTIERSGDRLGQDQPSDGARAPSTRSIGDLLESLAGKELFVLDCYAGADPTYRLPVRVINEFAWHNLFCRNLFIDDPR